MKRIMDEKSTFYNLNYLQERAGVPQVSPRVLALVSGPAEVWELADRSLRHNPFRQHLGQSYFIPVVYCSL